ncbi:TRAP transporter small permease [Vibrio splendidus]|uniref:TRAP transporter small permease n=1 Tax=Vibrio splendidus TaxID=29497 RepID=UPI000C85D88D|nr:TRAP transporter small permease subunit [Vibrio splendidus]PMH09711.1 C4-dicarboxylate ABC transporter substrate-binding protein [Vibrio splendidus]
MEGKFRKALDISTNVLLYCGGVIVIVQAFWITYGVFMRYVIGSPDGMVTEATALMLVPLAFVGLSYALKADAFPKVTIFIDQLSKGKRDYLEIANNSLMMVISVFFALAAFKGLSKSYVSLAASEVLLWPKYYFWAGVFVSLLNLSLVSILKLYDSIMHKLESIRGTTSVPQVKLGE